MTSYLTDEANGTILFDDVGEPLTIDDILSGTIATDTTNYLTLPINCVVIGDQQAEEKRREFDDRRPYGRQKTSMMGVRTASTRPTFRVRTDHRGYD